MKPRVFAALSVAVLLLAFAGIVVACGKSTDTDATATAEAELLFEATATAEALAEEIAPSLTATAEAREEAERAAAIATAEAEAVEATATAVASIGLSRDKPVPFGEAKVVPPGWEITVVDFTADATQIVLAEDTYSNTPPDSGFKYVMLRLRATNVSAGDPADLDAVNVLRLVGSRDVVYRDPCVFGAIPDGLGIPLPTEAFSGATLEGTVCFQVGEDESGFVMLTDFPGGAGHVYFSVE